MYSKTGKNSIIRKTTITFRQPFCFFIVQSPLYFMEESEMTDTEKLIKIISEFTPDQMNDFVTAAQDLIKRLQAEGSLGKEK